VIKNGQKCSVEKTLRRAIEKTKLTIVTYIDHCRRIAGVKPSLEEAAVKRVQERLALQRVAVGEGCEDRTEGNALLDLFAVGDGLLLDRSGHRLKGAGQVDATVEVFVEHDIHALPQIRAHGRRFAGIAHSPDICIDNLSLLGRVVGAVEPLSQGLHGL